MRKTGVMPRMILGLVLLVVLAGGVSTLVTDVQARGGCICPLIYAPVQCDHDKVYPNQCEADCHHARNCVPIGPF